MEGKDVVGLAKIPLALMWQRGPPLVPDVFRLLESAQVMAGCSPARSLLASKCISAGVPCYCSRNGPHLAIRRDLLVAAEAAEPLAVTLNSLSFVFRHVFLGVRAF
jgi:hypothetical protein